MTILDFAISDEEAKLIIEEIQSNEKTIKEETSDSVSYTMGDYNYIIDIHDSIGINVYRLLLNSELIWEDVG
jgi:hypothetical protein